MAPHPIPTYPPARGRGGIYAERTTAVACANRHSNLHLHLQDQVEVLPSAPRSHDTKTWKLELTPPVAGTAATLQFQ